MSTRQDMVDQTRALLAAVIPSADLERLRVASWNATQHREAQRFALDGGPRPAFTVPAPGARLVPARNAGRRTGAAAFPDLFEGREERLPPKVPGTDEALAAEAAARAAREAAKAELEAAERARERP